MIIHFIHHPVSAKKFVEPVVTLLNSRGVQTELWMENRKNLECFIHSIGCPKRFAKFDLSPNFFSILARLILLIKRFVSLKPKAIHAHQTRAAFIPLLAAWVAQVPIRIYRNGGIPYLGYRGFLRAILWFLEFLNCRLATNVITVSSSIRDKMIQHHIVPKPKVEVLGKGSSCGIDLVEFAAKQFDEQHKAIAKQTLGIPLNAFVVLYVGRPFKRKGFHTLLDAWRHSDLSNSENTLLIAGCTHNDVIRAAGVPIKNVTALGYVNDLRPCYAACDVVVLPSWHEGFPYSLLEGSAAARTLVGSDIPGIDSAILPNITGLLIPPRNAEALAEAFVVLKKNPDLRKKMGSAGRRHIEQYFDRNIFSGHLLDYYSKIGLKN